MHPARSRLLTLLSLGVVPIINENDTVVTDEIKFGDNDTLGALVTNLIEGDALIILTDQRGLYTADPRKHPDARFVDEARIGMLARIGGVQASLIRQDDQRVALDQVGDQRTQRVVVAELDLVGDDRVVLVDDRHHAQAQQRQQV